MREFNGREHILYLESQLEKAREIIEHLDSKCKRYEEYIESFGAKISSQEIAEDSYRFIIGTSYSPQDFRTYIRISMPDFVLGHRGRQQDILRKINEILRKDES